jgi:hypothetical protein
MKFKFFSPGPKSPTRTGLISEKNSLSNISCLGPFKVAGYDGKVACRDTTASALNWNPIYLVILNVYRYCPWRGVSVFGFLSLGFCVWVQCPCHRVSECRSPLC